MSKIIKQFDDFCNSYRYCDNCPLGNVSDCRHEFNKVNRDGKIIIEIDLNRDGVLYE